VRYHCLATSTTFTPKLLSTGSTMRKSNKAEPEPKTTHFSLLKACSVCGFFTIREAILVIDIRTLRLSFLL